MSAAEKEQKWHLLPFLLDLIGFGTSWSYSAGSSEAKTALMKLSGPLLPNQVLSFSEGQIYY